MNNDELITSIRLDLILASYDRRLILLTIQNGILYARFENEDDNPDDVQIANMRGLDLIDLIAPL